MSQRIKLSVLLFELVSIVALLVFNFKITPSEPSSSKVLAEKITQTPLPTLTPSPELTIQPPTPKPTKDSYVIAFIGDSMVETMGAGLPYIYKELTKKYPKIDFALYNFGIGSENVVEGISRFALPYAYKDQKHEPLPELGADIIVVGSYSYNPITPFDKNEAWLLLSDLVGKIKSHTKRVYILAEQAPIKDGFGQGPGGVNWPPEITGGHVENIILGLKNAVGLAEALEVGLINVYEESLAENSGYGKEELVTKHDGVHYSEEGQRFTAKVIADSIELP